MHPGAELSYIMQKCTVTECPYGFSNLAYLQASSVSWIYKKVGLDCIDIWGAAFQAAGHANALGQTEFEGSEQQWGGQGAWSKAKATVSEE